jgi:hypothetical protein
MKDLNEDKLTEIVIDFSKLDGTEAKVQEFYGLSGVSELGANIQSVLQRMFGMNSIPVTVRGTEGQISAFAKALGSERRYIETARNLGLTDPRAVRSKAQVQAAASEFKRKTGIEWPFK